MPNLFLSKQTTKLNFRRSLLSWICSNHTIWYNIIPRPHEYLNGCGNTHANHLQTIHLQWTTFLPLTSPLNIIPKHSAKVCTCVVLFLFVDRQFCQYCHEMLFFLIQQLILHIISFGSVWIIPTERPTDQPTEKQNIGKGTTTFTLLVDLVGVLLGFLWKVSLFAAFFLFTLDDNDDDGKWVDGDDDGYTKFVSFSVLLAVIFFVNIYFASNIYPVLFGDNNFNYSWLRCCCCAVVCEIFCF